MSTSNQLVQVSTSDGLYLHGFYAPSSDKKVALLHIHGFEGNFYENNFIYTLIKNFQENNIGFLTVNTRGNGMITDFNTVNSQYKTIGAHNELLEEAHLDISAWLKYLIKQGYEKIILQGHSLGTVKVISYLSEGEYKDKIHKLILLAPFENRMLDNVSLDTKASFTKYTKMFDFSNPNRDCSLLQQLKIPTKIIVGAKDPEFFPSQPNNYQKAMDILLKNIPDSQGVFIPDAIHCFQPNEELVTQEVLKFIKNK